MFPDLGPISKQKGLYKVKNSSKKLRYILEAWYSKDTQDTVVEFVRHECHTFRVYLPLKRKQKLPLLSPNTPHPEDSHHFHKVIFLLKVDF